MGDLSFETRVYVKKGFTVMVNLRGWQELEFCKIED